MLLLLLTLACSSSPYRELERQGLTEFSGEAEVIDSGTEGGDAWVRFDPATGPRCLRGGDYAVTTRDGSDTLLLFLQGGGACWSDFCLAVTEAPPGIPTMDVLDPEEPSNPLADASIAYLPYCDGSLFAGNVDHDDDGDGTIDRYQHGLHNLTAGLEHAAAVYPEPKQIVLAGSSGGGYGTILATPMVRILWPETPITVMNDAGVGVALGPDDPAFLRGLVDEWAAERFIPDSCEDCLTRGHLTDYVSWTLEQDENLRIGAYSTRRDRIIGDVFLAVGGDTFEPMLIGELDRLIAQHPGRYTAFVAEGDGHTTLLGDVRGFLGDALGDPEALEDVVTIGGLDTTEADGIRFSDWFETLVFETVPEPVGL